MHVRVSACVRTGMSEWSTMGWPEKAMDVPFHMVRRCPEHNRALMSRPRPQQECNVSARARSGADTTCVSSVSSTTFVFTTVHHVYTLSPNNPTQNY